MEPLVIHGLDGLVARQGEQLGYSDFVEVTQEQVDRFADATGDRQWIHIDVARARAESPFGAPVAHGYLTLSLGPMLCAQVVKVEGYRLGVNYGMNKVRFPAPLIVGSRVRLGVRLQEVSEVTGGVQVVYEFTFEGEGTTKPYCVAEVVVRRYS